MNEFESANRRDGLWAQLCAKYDGDELKIKAAYLNARAAEKILGGTRGFRSTRVVPRNRSAGSPRRFAECRDNDAILRVSGRMEWACIHTLSTAHVTGTVALLLGKNPRLSSSAVYQLLRTTSSGDTGGDSVDACAAVTMVVGHGSCLPSPSGAERVAMH